MTEWGRGLRHCKICLFSSPRVEDSSSTGTRTIALNYLITPREWISSICILKYWMRSLPLTHLHSMGVLCVLAVRDNWVPSSRHMQTGARCVYIPVTFASCFDPFFKKMLLFNSVQQKRFSMISLSDKLRSLVNNKQISIFISDPMPRWVGRIDFEFNVRMTWGKSWCKSRAFLFINNVLWCITVC